MALMVCAPSLRRSRRSRRRLEKDIVGEERGQDGDGVDNGRARKTRRSRSSKVADSKERLSPVPFLPPPCPVTESRDTAIDCEDCRGALDGIQERIFELVMWKNAAKSTLWFGLGTMFFLSSCFSEDFSFRFFCEFYFAKTLFLLLASDSLQS
ncbi:reticulon-like protein B18 [Zingiber officinale]|uniref:reticulon-like protein B18 n=1 Tax=Zingiber officinale TaxID=94328 RepID=UPI001C4C6E74|nr:reticulon-like protein B18 [Zingiber officinale]